jgi:hypothetical protein
MENTKRLAVLIDADNVSHRMIEAILSEVAKYGLLTSKRIYGDWSSNLLAGLTVFVSFLAMLTLLDSRPVFESMAYYR